jgi:hypothetical protein
MTYATAADIQARLGGNVLPEQKAAIADALLSACTAIDVWCGQTFTTAASATARVYRIRNSAYIANVDPFFQTTGLIIQTDSGYDGTFATTWASTDYELDRFGFDSADLLNAPYNTIRAVGANWFPVYGRRRNTLQVTAFWGWAAPPQNIIEATKILAADLWWRRNTPNGVMSAGLSEFGAVRISKNAFAQVESLLDRFVRVDRTMGFA